MEVPFGRLDGDDADVDDGDDDVDVEADDKGDGTHP